MWFNQYLESEQYRHRICAVELQENNQTKLTYEQLYAGARNVSANIIKWFDSNSGRSSAVGVFMDTGLDLLTSLHGIWLAGCGYLCLETSLPQARLKFLIENAGVQLVITQEQFLVDLCWLQEDLQNPFGILLFENKRSKFISYPPEVRSVTDVHQTSRNGILEHNDKDKLAYVIYTSGSTGHPKGVACTHSGVENFCDGIIKTIGINSNSVQLQFASTSFDTSVQEIFPTLLVGGKLILANKTLKAPGPKLAALIQSQEITDICLAPTILGMLNEFASELKSLKRIVFAGEQCLVNLVKIWMGLDRQVFNVYGPTEATVAATTYKINFIDEKIPHVPIGKPLPGVNIYVLKEGSQEICLPGTIGEIVLGGKGIAQGYIPGPGSCSAGSAEAFGTLMSTGERIYRTCDLGVIDQKGTLTCLGRIDTSQVKVRGLRIELSEIENAMLKIPGIQSAVAKVFTELWQDGTVERKILAAFYVRSNESVIMNDHLISLNLSKQIPNYMIPSTIIELQELPLLSNNCKVDRAALPLPIFVANNFSKNTKDYLSLTTTSQLKPIVHEAKSEQFEGLDQLQILCRIFEIALNLVHGTIMPDSNFFNFGGDSLKISQVLVNAEMFMKISNPSWTNYDTATPRALLRLWNMKNSTGGAQLKTFALLQESFYVLPAEFAIIPTQLVPKPSRSVSKSLLIAGATGFLGSWILFSLLSQADFEIVYCIVRTYDGSSVTAQERVRASFQKYGLLSKSSFNNVVFLSGDISHKNLGLSQTKYAELCSVVNVVVNSAANISYIEGFDGCYSANVKGTKELLNFCGQCRVKSYHHISTLNVFGAETVLLGLDTVDEEFDLLRTKKIMNYEIGYAQTKWVAERMVEQAREQGLPANIYRPGFISGDTGNGIGNRTDLFCRLIGSCVQMKCYPDLPKYFWCVVPVDWVAEVVVKSIIDENRMGKTFHLSPNRQVEPSHNQIFEIVESILKTSFTKISLTDWLREIEHVLPTNPIYPLVSYLTTKSFYDRSTVLELHYKTAIIECKNTLEMIEKTSGMACPSLDKNLMSKYLKFILEL